MTCIFHHKQIYTLTTYYEDCSPPFVASFSTLTAAQAGTYYAPANFVKAEVYDANMVVHSTWDQAAGWNLTPAGTAVHGAKRARRSTSG